VKPKQLKRPKRPVAAVPRQVGQCLLRLFVAGATDRSRKAVLHVRQLCAAELPDKYRLEVIDIYQQPQMARDHQIVATPTLIKEFPRPVRRFIGNLLHAASLFPGPGLATASTRAL